LIGTSSAFADCGQQRPAKQVAEHSTANIDTSRFLDHIRTQFQGAFKGYAVILTGAAGQRLGFRREGWAVDPCEGQGIRFDLNTESAIGSVSKLFTTVAVLKAPNYYTRDQQPFTDFLPNQWRNYSHNFYHTISVADLLQHKGGFLKSGGGTHIRVRLHEGLERNPLSFSGNPRSYSNTSMGLFHFIYAKFGFDTTDFLNPDSVEDIESAYGGSFPAYYDPKIQVVTAAAYNHGLYQTVLNPLSISATCDARVTHFPASNSIRYGSINHYPFYSVAKSYRDSSDTSGRLLASSINNCAAGGLYMSAKDLARFMSALGDTSFLSASKRNLMINNGAVDDLYAFNAIDAEGGRAFWHNGKRTEGGGDTSYAVVIRFASGANAVFVANSDNEGTNTLRTIRDAYNLARQ
jgi:CubicO group peptidase (beta-lactamase class C family)